MTSSKAKTANSGRPLALFISAMMLCFVSCRAPGHSPEMGALLNPAAPEVNERAPDVFVAQFSTSKGNIDIEVHRAWSPHGADRFYNLVRSGYYDGVRFHRIRAGTWAQFGISGDP